jgi:hypothetical protein
MICTIVFYKQAIYYYPINMPCFDRVTTVNPTFELSFKFLLSVLGVGSTLVIILTTVVAVISVITPINSSLGIGLEIKNFIGLESSYQHSAFQPPSPPYSEESLTVKFWNMKAADAKNMKKKIPYWMICVVLCKLDLQHAICRLLPFCQTTISEFPKSSLECAAIIVGTPAMSTVYWASINIHFQSHIFLP